MIYLLFFPLKEDTSYFHIMESLKNILHILH